MPSVLSVTQIPATFGPLKIPPATVIDPADLEGKTTEEKLQLAIAAIRQMGLKPNSQPIYSFTEAASTYKVSKTTLIARFNGRGTRVEAHEKERKLTKGEEDALVEWIQEKGQRNIPLQLSAVAEHAQFISGAAVSEAWVRKFRSNHPELKCGWATGLEKCRASALNKPNVEHFYKTLESLITEYNIKPENMYNMDEKGVQLGVGGRTKVLVDRDQKSIQQLEDGCRELVTILECVCADGTVLPPSVVYQAVRRCLEWGRDNPCFASICHSLKGWTDQELGAIWLEKDFEPFTRKKLGNPDEYRLLILDGHNSHTTYRFCSFAEKHKIIVYCLPPHTTHRLQPCDVGAFGPLESTWKAEVNKASSLNLPIRKHNFLRHYHNAREKAFSKPTILSAFRKTGIHPLNPSAIPEDDYAPALNTTTQASQPIGATLPALLEPTTPHPRCLRSVSFSGPISHSNPHTSPSPASTPSNPLSNTSSRRRSGTLSHCTTASRPSLLSTASPPASHITASSLSSSRSSLDNDAFARMCAEQVYHISGLPKRASAKAPKDVLLAENVALRNIIDRCCYQMQRDYAVKKLMEKENEMLRQRLFAKTNKPTKKVVNTLARHMTSEENLEELAVADWKASMKLVFASSEFKGLKKKLEDDMKNAQAEAKAAEKEKEREKREEEKREKERQKEIEAREKEEKKRAQAEEREKKKKKAEEERARRQAEAAQRKANTAVKKAQAEQKKAEAAKVRAEKAKRDEEEALKGVLMERRRVEAAATRMAAAAATPRVRAYAKQTPRSPSEYNTPIHPICSALGAPVLVTPSRPSIKPRIRRRNPVERGEVEEDEAFIVRRSGRLNRA